MHGNIPFLCSPCEEGCAAVLAAPRLPYGRIEREGLYNTIGKQVEGIQINIISFLARILKSNRQGVYARAF